MERDTGDLLMYIAKSDAFEINAMPVKVARVRLQFDPPLWSHNQSGWNQTLSLADGSVGAWAHQHSSPPTITPTPQQELGTSRLGTTKEKMQLPECVNINSSTTDMVVG